LWLVCFSGLHFFQISLNFFLAFLQHLKKILNKDKNRTALQFSVSTPLIFCLLYSDFLFSLLLPKYHNISIFVAKMRALPSHEEIPTYGEIWVQKNLVIRGRYVPLFWTANTEFKDKKTHSDWTFWLEIWHYLLIFLKWISEFADKKTADNEVRLFLKFISVF
jgi:hypothetical protein